LRPLRRGTLKFQCPVCQNCVCVDCDTYLHESLHNCPGCLSQPITMNPR
jgi:transcription initiation factor TFIIH subunit 2